MAVEATEAEETAAAVAVGVALVAVEATVVADTAVVAAAVALAAVEATVVAETVAVAAVAPAAVGVPTGERVFPTSHGAA